MVTGPPKVSIISYVL